MRSLLFVPADSERKIAKGLSSGADALILDLEDSVAPSAKEAARRLAAEVLRSRKEGHPALLVRVNPLSSGLTPADVEVIAPAGPDGLVQPKTESAEDVLSLSAMAAGIPVIAIATETARAMFCLGTYDQAVPPLAGLAWGAEDLSNDLGAETNRDEEGSFTEPYRYARTLCLLAARAAGVEPIDTVYVNFRDRTGFEADCRAGMRDGFTGKLAIHPDQVEIINRIFTPAPEAVARATRIVEAFAATDVGVVGIEGEMVDRPHLLRAERLLERARKYGL
ncbi:MAG: CoA ester lyase [Parvibaculaceae bacterium]